MKPNQQIPVGSQFSPKVIHLRPFLAALVAHSGSKSDIEDAVWNPSVRHKAKAEKPTKRNKSLPVEAAVQYGLLTKDYVPTPVCVDLAALSGTKLAEAFARHILLHCGGLRVLEICIQMEMDGLRVGADPLARYATEQGFFIAEHNTAINSLRMWLEAAGIFSKGGWVVDVKARDRILGLSGEMIPILAGLNEDQREFALALCRLNPSGWCSAASVRKLAETHSARTLPRSSARKSFLEVLENAGLIEFRTKGISGGKTAELRTTEAFRADLLGPFLEQTVKTLDPSLVSYYSSRAEDIYADLGSSSTDKKGRALEAFTVYVMRLLGLRFEGWRRRASDTGGAEVDVLLSGVFGVAPTRWQVQCKNTPSGSLRQMEVAREVGLATITGSTHILIVANCSITRDAQRFAAKVNEHTATTVFLVGGDDFEAIRKDPGALADILRTQAAKALELRRRLNDEG